MTNNTPIIARTAMLTALHISQWSARKFDKSASSDLNLQKRAKDVARVNKLLVAGDAIKPIQQLATAVRQEYYKRTLPWGDNGERVMPAKMYQDWMLWYDEQRSAFDQLVDEFAATTYREQVRDAAYRMGDLFDLSDYPRPSEVRLKFSMRFDVRPIPTQDDFRVDISADLDKVLRQQVADDLDRLTGETMRHLWSQVGEMLTNIADRLADPDARFRVALLENFTELVDDLDKLNIADDPELHRLQDTARKQLMALRDPKAMREDKPARAAAAAEARKLADEFSGMWG